MTYQWEPCRACDGVGTPIDRMTKRAVRCPFCEGKGRVEVYNLWCPECGAGAALVDSAVIYGTSYGPVWKCAAGCDTYVGVHRGTNRPKGTLANAETREWRKRAHAAFDPIWQSGAMTRKEAYRALADALGIREAHIGESDVDRCCAIIEWSYTAAPRPSAGTTNNETEGGPDVG